jgi:hypothetical protein
MVAADAERLVMPGRTVNVVPAVVLPFTVTATASLPAINPLGTGTAMLLALQIVGVPEVPLNFTVLEP